MIIKDLIQRVKALFNQGVQSDDARLSSRHIYNKLVTVRSMLVSQQIKKKQKVSDWNYVVLPCVELIKVPNHECSCLGDLGCDVWRTKHPIPKTLTDLNKHLIAFVMSVDSTVVYNEATREEILYNKGNKYTSSKPKYVIENSHLYFPLKQSPSLIKIKFLPEDPLVAAAYPSVCEDCTDCVDCRNYNLLEFPIDGDLIEPLITIAKEELVADFSKGKNDTTNDTTDN